MNGKTHPRLILTICVAFGLLTGCATLARDACGGGMRRPVNLYGSIIGQGAQAAARGETARERRVAPAPERDVQ